MLAAIEVCRQRWAKSLLADPLGYAEFDGESGARNFATSSPVELESITLPKQGGGTRLEVVPDFVTSVALQVIAEQMDERDLALPHSVSASQLWLKCMEGQLYELWSDTVPMWIRHMLVGGKTVVVADVQDYFASIPICRIEFALRDAQLEEEIIERTLHTIGDINSIPDHLGKTRSGLPVTQDSLFWIIADLVLGPVDEQLVREPAIAGHLRWVDDFFIAVDSGAVEGALMALSTALEPIGLRINEGKTRVMSSLVAFERQVLTYEHRMVTSLMMASSRGPLSRSQGDAFKKLVETDRGQSMEHARLWKRIYTLASHLHSSVLATQAIDDLTRFPTAEKEISSYLRILNWPSGTGIQAVKQIARAVTDSESICLLHALLSADQPPDVSTRNALKDMSYSACGNLHPYALVLLHACLMAQQPKHERSAIAKQIFPLLTDSRSPMARRIAIEFMWLIPEHRRLLVELTAKDTSHTVRGLAALPAMADGKSQHAYPPADNHSEPTVPFSGPMGFELREALLRVAE